VDHLGCEFIGAGDDGVHSIQDIDKLDGAVGAATGVRNHFTPSRG
jgi:hypothetical protein